MLTVVPSRLSLAFRPSFWPHIHFPCVGFQMYKQGGLEPKPSSWVQTSKWRGVWKHKFVGRSISPTSFSFCLCSRKACSVLDRARTAQRSKSIPSLILWVMQTGYLNSPNCQVSISKMAINRMATGELNETPCIRR